MIYVLFVTGVVLVYGEFCWVVNPEGDIGSLSTDAFFVNSYIAHLLTSVCGFSSVRWGTVLEVVFHILCV